MQFHSQSYEKDDEVVVCQECGYKNTRRMMNCFDGPRNYGNIYGLKVGTILCGTCLLQHRQWLKDNKILTGEIIQTQEIHTRKGQPYEFKEQK